MTTPFELFLDAFSLTMGVGTAGILCLSLTFLADAVLNKINGVK